MTKRMQRKPFTIAAGIDEGSRLLDWISARFTYLSLEEWRRMIDEGRVEVQGRTEGADRVLREGELVAFAPPPLEEPPVDSRVDPVWEDEDFLVAEKSGNLPCHPGGRYFEHTLLRLLSKGSSDLRIITRLDRETSGLVLLAKSAKAACVAHAAMASGSIVKSYLAMTQGRFPAGVEAEGFLVNDTESAVRKKRRFIKAQELIDEPKPERCSSSFELLACADFELGPVSLVRCHPKTGRTHQLRASLLALGFPIMGDKLYGVDEGIFLRFIAGRTTKEDLKRLVLPNQALHCSGLSFRSVSGEMISLASRPRWPEPYNELLT
jgi:RluA family pseudouridine synthase